MTYVAKIIKMILFFIETAILITSIKMILLMSLND